jgi:hypothetical protein
MVGQPIPIHFLTSTEQHAVGASELSLSHRLAASGVAILLLATLWGAWVQLIGLWPCPLSYLSCLG